MNLNGRNNQAGFTLIEVLIAFMILVFISFAIYQLTTNTFRLRSNLSDEGDFYNEIRLSLGILSQDISMIFSPKLVIPPVKKKKNPTPSGSLSSNPPRPLIDETEVPSKFWGYTIDRETGIRNTRFLGSKTSLSFVGSTHLRIYRDSPQSIYSKVEYRVINDESSPDGVDEKTSVLVKTDNPNVFDLENDEDKSLETYPLMRGIKTWKFKYYLKSKDKWYSDWDNRKTDFRNLIPDLIEVNFVVLGKNGKQFEGMYRFKPDVPFEGISANF